VWCSALVGRKKMGEGVKKGRCVQGRYQISDIM
jgi:hypothetical protein